MAGSEAVRRACCEGGVGTTEDVSSRVCACEINSYVSFGALQRASQAGRHQRDRVVSSARCIDPDRLLVRDQATSGKSQALDAHHVMAEPLAIGVPMDVLS